MTDGILDIVPAIILILGAYRITRFFTFDSLFGFNPGSGSKMSIRLDAWAYKEDGSDRTFLRGKIGDLLVCMFCLGFWVSVALLATYIAVSDVAYPGIVLFVINAFAIAGGQAMLGSRLNA